MKKGLKNKNKESFLNKLDRIDPQTKRLIFLIAIGFLIISPLLGWFFDFIEGIEFQKIAFRTSLLLIGVVLFMFVWIKKPRKIKGKAYIKEDSFKKANRSNWILLLSSFIIMFIGGLFIETNINYTWIGLIIGGIIVIFTGLRILKNWNK
ncbi:hypothetical protein CMI46_02755 [Candidatus Pacearchaeota archaeon]|nr:hypothetical protein [Candidatus Pacearchaeota archaeon]